MRGLERFETTWLRSDGLSHKKGKTVFLEANLCGGNFLLKMKTETFENVKSVVSRKKKTFFFDPIIAQNSNQILSTFLICNDITRRR